MSERVEVTLKQLAELALGAPEYNSSNKLFLLSLIEILLKKLDCKNEKVIFSGLEAKCLKETLPITTVSPIAFNTENILIIPRELSLLTGLEYRIAHLEHKLDAHFEEARKSNPQDIIYKKCSSFLYPCADFCTICDPEFELACKLLNNCEFIAGLTKTVAPSIMNRILEVGGKIEEMTEVFVDFMKSAIVEYKKVLHIERCIYELSELRKKIAFFKKKFIGTMDEVQDRMDGKLDRVHMQPLKMYLHKQITELLAEIAALKANKECPRAACFTTTPLPVNDLCDDAEDILAGNEQKLKKYCGCKDICKEEAIEALKNPKPKNVVKMCTLKRDYKPVELLEGTNGNFYRKG